MSDLPVKPLLLSFELLKLVVHLVEFSLHRAVLCAQIDQSKQEKEGDEDARPLQKLTKVVKHFGPGKWLLDLLPDLILVPLDSFDHLLTFTF